MTQRPVIVSEGTTDILVYKKKTTSRGPGEKTPLPFYNPSMELNRDVSILLVQWFLDIRSKPLHLLDGLAASGIRGIRFANELNGDYTLTINDWNEQAHHLIDNNIKQLAKKSIISEQKNLNILLSKHRYDYIDVDPFGSPIGFLDSAMRGIKHDGIVAVTATDTATLCGKYPKACKRRYNAVPFHGCCQHETGLRIFLGVLSREAAKYDKGIIPLLSYYQDHYFRIYIQIKNNKTAADNAQKKLQIISVSQIDATCSQQKHIGPLWIGPLHHRSSVAQIREYLFTKKLGSKPQLIKLFDLWIGEATLPPFYYTTDDLASYTKSSPIKVDKLIQLLHQNGYAAAHTHFSPTGVKTTASFEEIITLLSAPSKSDK